LVLLSSLPLLAVLQLRCIILLVIKGSCDVDLGLDAAILCR
jgi:hypothetical protein